MNMPAGLVVQADQRLAEQLHRLARQRMVFFAGAPGTGKSLLAHQLVHLADEGSRRVHLLQWDVARPVFERIPAGRRYPIANGVTHAVIRKAAGLWVRGAVAEWSERHPAAEHLLIGETPFVGNRFVELAQRGDDPAEPVLSAEACRFALPVPSSGVKRHLEAERERRAVRPLHPREREDAPPSVLRGIWNELGEVASRLGLGVPTASYESSIYRRLYETVLRHRHVDVLPLDVILPTEALSVYDFARPPSDVVPSDAEADELVRVVERRYPDVGKLDREVAHWWIV